MSDNDGPKPPNCKVVLLGDSGVGKTCIISRYISGQFDENSASTNGASYASKNVEYPELGKNLMLDIWDTAGQEKYKALTKFFYKDASVAILVYDITSKLSFDNIKDYWYKQIQENGEKNVVLGIAGNKCDLYEKEEISEEDAKEFAKSIGAVFALTSAKDNNGIDKLFEAAGHKYLDPKKKEKQAVDKETQKEEKGEKITLDKKDMTKKETKKKGGFC